MDHSDHEKVDRCLKFLNSSIENIDFLTEAAKAVEKWIWKVDNFTTGVKVYMLLKKHEEGTKAMTKQLSFWTSINAAYGSTYLPKK